MPPRFTFWTIILDGQPTAFRAAEREALLPTLKQLQSKNPDAVLKWFAHGKVWDSPEEARAHQGQRGRGGHLQAEGGGRRAAGNPPSASRLTPDERRRGDWRPGGEHRDPREKFKKETFQARKRREKKAAALARQGRAEGGFGQQSGGGQKAEGGFNRAPSSTRPWENRGPKHEGGGRKAEGGHAAPKRPWNDRAKTGGFDRGQQGGGGRAEGGFNRGPSSTRPWENRGPKHEGGGRRAEGGHGQQPGGGRKAEGGRPREGGVHEQRGPSGPSSDRVRNRGEHTPTAPPEAPRPVVPEPTRPPEPARPAPPYPEEHRPSRPGPPSESIRVTPSPPEQGAPPESPGTPAPPHKTKMPRLRKK